MVYITSIPIKKPYIHSPIFRRRPIYTHQNGNFKPYFIKGLYDLKVSGMVGA